MHTNDFGEDESEPDAEKEAPCGAQQERNDPGCVLIVIRHQGGVLLNDVKAITMLFVLLLFYLYVSHCS